jgi:hypothetical protein
VCCSGEYEVFGEGFGERLSHRARGGVAGGDGVEGCCNCDCECDCECECGCDCESDEERRRQSSGFMSFMMFGGGMSVSSGGGGDVIDLRRRSPSESSRECSRVAVAATEESSGPVSDAVPCGPMISDTMRPRSTPCEGEVSGSISCEAAEGGGQTLSWNMEPDSDARARRRRGGEDVDEGLGGRACT